MGGGVLLIVHVIGHGREQASGIPHAAKQVIQQGRHGGLPVRAGHTHQLKVLGRMPIPLPAICAKAIALLFTCT